MHYSLVRVPQTPQVPHIQNLIDSLPPQSGPPLTFSSLVNWASIDFAEHPDRKPKPDHQN